MGLDRAGADGLDLQNQITSAGFGASDPTSHVAAVVEFKMDESSYMDTMSKFLEMSSSQTDKLKNLQESMWQAVFGKPEEQLEKMSDNVEKLFQNMLERLSQSMIQQGDSAVSAIRNALDNATRELPALQDRLTAAGVPSSALGKFDFGDDAEMRSVGPYGNVAMPLREIRHAMAQQHAQASGSGLHTPRLPTLSDQLAGAAGNNQKLQQAALQTLYASGTPEVDTSPSMGAAGHLLSGLGAQGLGKMLERPGASFATPHGGAAGASSAIGDLGGFGYGGLGAAEAGVGQMGEKFVEHQAANSLLHSAAAQGAGSMAGKLAGKFGRMIPGGGMALEALGGLGAGAGVVGGGMALGGLALGLDAMYTGSYNELAESDHTSKALGYTVEQSRRFLQTMAAIGNTTYVSNQAMEQFRDTIMGMGGGAGYTNAAMGTGAMLMAAGGMSSQQAGQTMQMGQEYGLSPYQSMNQMFAAQAGAQKTGLSVSQMQNTQLASMGAAVGQGMTSMGNLGIGLTYGMGVGNNRQYSFMHDPNALASITGFAAGPRGRQIMASRLGLSADAITQMDDAHQASTTQDYLSAMADQLVGMPPTQRQFAIQAWLQSGQLPAGIGAEGMTQLVEQRAAGHRIGGSAEDIQRRMDWASDKATGPQSWSQLGLDKKHSAISKIQEYGQMIGSPLDAKGAEEAYGKMHTRDRIEALKKMFPGGIPPQLAARILYDPSMTDDKLEHFSIQKDGKKLEIGKAIQGVVHGDNSEHTKAVMKAFGGKIGHDPGMTAGGLDNLWDSDTSEGGSGSHTAAFGVGYSADWEFSKGAKWNSKGISLGNMSSMPDLHHLPGVGDPMGAGNMKGGKGSMNVGTIAVQSIVVSPSGAADLYSAMGTGATEAGFPMGHTPGGY